ncbi:MULTISPECIES: S1C family serine protease [unclassified Polaromonas]|uniref:S1C family serine protease n=1 Tax=unclassified Polaromonas TaxID=2638319 RepID=UPI000F07F96E|nr:MULTISPECIES: S1C family serine protease [unclassified Polaromonas]AYQ27832.1 serine protease [Polaromonas sp. SP1]QGJ17309.1 trypsin-like serine protease [Polaromonas sp. Pch-P]
MKIARLLITLAATAAATTTAFALEPEEIFKRAAPAVWTVKADVGNNQVAIGSAVAITPSLLVTACHVVSKAITIKLTQQQREVKVIRITRDPVPEHDLCVLQTEPGVALATVTIAPIDTVRTGAKAYAIGSPHGLELTLSEGLVSSLRANNTSTLPTIQTSASISSGSSGGGLFDAEARLMGVTINISPGGENLGFAYPAQLVMELPKRIDAELVQWRERLKNLGVVMGANGEPTPSGHAELDNEAALPVLGGGSDPAALRLAYKQFLLQSQPRAFMITSDGQFGAVTSLAGLNEQVASCAQKKITCAVYAVNGTVVWGKQQPAR